MYLTPLLRVELEAIRKNLKADQVQAIADAIETDTLRVGSPYLGVFAQVFGSADHKSAIAFRKKCDLRLTKSDQSMLEKYMVKDKHFGYLCASYLADLLNIDQIPVEPKPAPEAATDVPPEAPLFLEETVQELAVMLVSGMDKDMVKENFPNVWRRYNAGLYRLSTKDWGKIGIPSAEKPQ